MIKNFDSKSQIFPRKFMKENNRVQPQVGTDLMPPSMLIIARVAFGRALRPKAADLNNEFEPSDEDLPRVITGLCYGSTRAS